MYMLANVPENEDLDKLGLSIVDIIGEQATVSLNARRGRRLRAKLIGEKRSPLAGEWYLSGAIPKAYRAPNDLPKSTSYHILKLVLVKN